MKDSVEIASKIVSLIVTVILLLLVFPLISILSLYDPSSTGWWFLLLVVLGLIGIVIRGIYQFGMPLLVKLIQLQNPVNLTTQEHGQIVELARLQYYLNDPGFPNEFDAFLDSRSLSRTRACYGLPEL